MKNSIILIFIISSAFSQNCVNKLSQEQINAILDAHNIYRNIVASGNQNSAGGQLPSASNMKVLEWSTELEDLAQSWANFNPKTSSPYRKVSNITSPMNKGYIGENIFWAVTFYSTIREPGNYSAQNSVKAWFDEVKNFKQPINVLVNLDPTRIIGHFTQVVWAETTKIGCGILDCFSSEKSTFVNMYTQTSTIVCNYWSGGNINFIPIYKKGTPCSNCTCSNKYTSLCV